MSKRLPQPNTPQGLELAYKLIVLGSNSPKTQQPQHSRVSNPQELISKLILANIDKQAAFNHTFSRRKPDNAALQLWTSNPPILSKKETTQETEIGHPGHRFRRSADYEGGLGSSSNNENRLPKIEYSKEEPAFVNERRRNLSDREKVTKSLHVSRPTNSTGKRIPPLRASANTEIKTQGSKQYTEHENTNDSQFQNSDLMYRNSPLSHNRRSNGQAGSDDFINSSIFNPAAEQLTSPTEETQRNQEGKAPFSDGIIPHEIKKAFMPSQLFTKKLPPVAKPTENSSVKPVNFTMTPQRKNNHKEQQHREQSHQVKPVSEVKKSIELTEENTAEPSLTPQPSVEKVVRPPALKNVNLRYQRENFLGISNLTLRESERYSGGLNSYFYPTITPNLARITGPSDGNETDYSKTIEPSKPGRIAQLVNEKLKKRFEALEAHFRSKDTQNGDAEKQIYTPTQFHSNFKIQKSRHRYHDSPDFRIHSDVQKTTSDIKEQKTIFDIKEKQTTMEVPEEGQKENPAQLPQGHDTIMSYNEDQKEVGPRHRSKKSLPAVILLRTRLSAVEGQEKVSGGNVQLTVAKEKPNLKELALTKLFNEPDFMRNIGPWDQGSASGSARN